MTSGPVLIVGAGHAGFQLAASLRQHGFGERIVPDQMTRAHLPYQRPPLSKAYLKGDRRTGYSLMFRPDKILPRSEHRFDHADRATSIDRAARRVSLASGASLDYGHLVLATGGAQSGCSIFPMPILTDVRYLRTLDDSEALRHRVAIGGSASS